MICSCADLRYVGAADGMWLYECSEHGVRREHLKLGVRRKSGTRPESRGPQNVLRTLPTDSAERKGMPICSGVLDYFPLAIAEVARVSQAGNDQHNPGQPLHWAREKSADHEDCIVRHLIERGTRDRDGQRHSAKLAWRALALLQEELEAEAGLSSGGDEQAASPSPQLDLFPEEVRGNRS
jgi:hypothetical protein